ncbi:sel1 repeat family protein [Streptomyces piniterrae]|uniref:Sel1 repeat family protein n=1 Tax=Streptomyces piniterrae TaxID=2571125 RepID=A0A4U0MP96_9ACTN|nr:tetratricopeptide repeat protein [Streptomyces piniterrae]TJZ42523.1 sel1 repeat family protein [Streptomyces piniterrae]
MEPELVALADSGARALVGAMGTDAWAEVRTRVTHLFSGAYGGTEPPQLPDASGTVASSFAVRLLWQLKLHELLEREPRAADPLRAILDEIPPRPVPTRPVPTRPVEPVGGVHNTVAGGTQGSVVQAASIGTVTVHTSAYAETLLDPQGWPQAEDVDRIALGVRPTYRRDGRSLPPYVARDRDEELLSAMTHARSHGGLVLVLGEPFTGKSRTALEAMAQGFAGFRVFAPASGADLRGLPALLHGRPGRHLVWLDDLDGHLGEGGLEPRLLDRLTGLRVVVLATMRDDAYDEHRHTPHGRVLDLAHTVELGHEWSPAERERLALRAGVEADPRLTAAVCSSGPEGVPAYLALAPLLWEEWWRARRAERHPRGHALVRAALDLARCGLDGPLPMSLLLKVHEGYADVDGMDRESMEDALAWATERRHGLLRLLVRVTGDTWRAAPFLVEAAARQEELPAVDGQVWGCALEVARTDGAYDYKEIAVGAHAAFHRAAEAGDSTALHNLGLLAESLGELADAEGWFRRAADAGQTQSAGRLGRMLAERGAGKEAEPFLEIAAEAGDAEAATLLGRLLRDRAERWLRAGMGGGSPEAAHRLGDLLLGSGDEDDALACYIEAIDAGYPQVAASFARLGLLWNDREEAEVWFRRAADAGDWQAQMTLRHTLGPRRRVEDAERELRESAEEDKPLAAANLGVLLEMRGRPDEARTWHLKAYETGDPYGAFRLAELHKKDGETAEAQAWYRKAADMGHPGAERALGESPDATVVDD